MKKVKFIYLCIKFKYILLYLFLLTSLIFNYKLYKNNANLKELNNIRTSNLDILDNTIKELFKSQKTSWEIESHNLKNFIVDSKNGKNLTISNLELKNKLIFYFHSNMCSFCVENEIKKLKELADVIGLENVIILTNGYKYKYLYNSPELGYFSNLYTLKSFDFIKKNILNTPLYIYIDKNGCPKYIYASLGTTNKLSSLYANFIKTIYKN